MAVHRRKCMAVFLLTNCECQLREAQNGSIYEVAIEQPACLSSWSCNGRTHQLNLPQKGANLRPAREDALLFLWEVDGHGGVVYCVSPVRGGDVFLVFDSPQRLTQLSIRSCAVWWYEVRTLHSFTSLCVSGHLSSVATSSCSDA
jgi:hypothetical protein